MDAEMAIEKIQGIIRAAQQKNPPIHQQIDMEKLKKSLNSIGRNAACPCGSGLKFKKCCLR